MARAEDWYAARGLPPRFLVAGPVGFAVGEDRLGALLLDRGYHETNRSVVMTAAAQVVADAGDGAADVEVTEALTPRWLDAYARQREVVPGATESVLTGSPGQLFASAATGGQVVAVARLGLVAGGWAGLYGVWVGPEHRGQGLARALTGALAARAVARGTRSLYLQTLHANEPAVGLYSSLGFSPHHGYSYLDR